MFPTEEEAGGRCFCTDEDMQETESSSCEIRTIRTLALTLASFRCFMCVYMLSLPT